MLANQQNQSAALVVLTHRRGTAVALVPLVLFEDALQSNNSRHAQFGKTLESLAQSCALSKNKQRITFSEVALSWFQEMNRLLTSGAKAAVVETPDLSQKGAFVTSPDSSAECLWKNVRALHGMCGVSDSNVQLVACSAGPVGSFTGLRIGASFCSGLVFGRKRALQAIPNHSFAFLKDLKVVTQHGIEPLGVRLDGFKEAQAWDSIGSDHGSAVLPVELLISCAQIVLGLCEEKAPSKVAYSAEPGPVIQRALASKLNKKEGQ